MSRSLLVGIVVVLVVALAGMGIYAYQQSQRPGIEVKVDSNGLKINSNG